MCCCKLQGKRIRVQYIGRKFAVTVYANPNRATAANPNRATAGSNYWKSQENKALRNQNPTFKIN